MQHWSEVSGDSLFKSSLFSRSSFGESSETEAMNDSSWSIVPAWKKYTFKRYMPHRSKQQDIPLPSAKADLEEVKQALMKVRRVASEASLHNLSQEYKMQLKPVTSRPKRMLSRCSSFIDRSAFKTDSTCNEKRSNCPFSYVDSSSDYSKAIRISQEDGGVDIAKEYRKLYLSPDTSSRRSFLAQSRFSMRNLQAVYSGN